MRILIVATTQTLPHAHEEIAQGNLHRIDYLDLAQRLETRYLDYSVARNNGRLMRTLESRLRLDLRQARYVAAYARHQHYDLVFSLSERVGIPLAYLLPRNVRHVVQVHHLLSAKKLRILKAGRVPQRWDGIIALSYAEATALKTALPALADRIHCLLNPVDTSFFAPISALTNPGEQPYIMSVGLSHRDYPTLVRALQLLPQIPGHLYLGSNWVSGSGALGTAPLPVNVTTHPYVPPQLLRERYGNSQFVVVPIQETSQWSAGCNAVLQAQAMGKPVIATRTPGMSDYVLDGVTGMLVEPNNPRAMALAIQSLWNDPSKATAMGQRARQWIQANFSLDTWLDEAATLVGATRKPASA